ncbi:MAG TPA: hypothetical protein PLF23_24570, partial [Candidatus Obscuribacter sp.]|nr:hypothetical protein [Candidatus Obscuribacter sp.]
PVTALGSATISIIALSETVIRSGCKENRVTSIYLRGEENKFVNMMLKSAREALVFKRLR